MEKEEEKIEFKPVNMETNISESSARQEQVHEILFSKEISWQEIIYDLIHTEQLDPWDINIIILTDKFLGRLQELEEEDFFISSKVLHAAALLLRLKSEFLLEKYIKSIDEVLFGKKDEKKSYQLERIELDEEIPELIPRSPMPRLKKVTLAELMESLNKAIITENRRIKKEIIKKNALRETAISLPKRNFSIKDKIEEIYNKLFGHLNEEKKKVSFTDVIGIDREERILSFYPLLQLENQHKVWLEQESHFEEIFIWLKDVYLKHNGDPYKNLKEELEKEFEELEKKEKKKGKILGENFSEPLKGISDD